MLSVEEALDRLLRGLVETDAERLPLGEALGRVPTSAAISAPMTPPFANSAMDGFALLAADGGDRRRLVGESRAGGASPPAVERGTTVRIMTGAPMPEGADSVVPIEDASEAGGWVEVARAPEPGAYVRAAGHTTSRPQRRLSLSAGPITPSVIGLLAAMGHADVEVRRRPRVAILSTGDELVPVGSPLGPGQIHDANGPALAAAVTEAGGMPLLLERARDDPAEIEPLLRDGVLAADMLIASGGVSVGQHDHVRGVIQRLGTIDFWRIAVQPGKPLAFGRVGSGRSSACPATR